MHPSSPISGTSSFPHARRRPSTPQRLPIHRWLSLFARPAAVPMTVAVSLLFAVPALFGPLAADDHYHALILRGDRSIPGVPTDPSALFIWADGTARMAYAFMEAGLTGWWTNPELLMSYARPLSVLSHRLDYALFPDSTLWMHLHTVLWFALSLFGLAALYRRLQSDMGVPYVAGLSLFLFAFDDAHGLALSWIANRNALIALAVAVPSLVVHDMARRDGRRGMAWLSPLLLLVALLAGESALAMCGFLFSYALFVDRRGPWRGCAAIAPHGVIAVVYALSYRALGFGARGSGLAVDPSSEPLRYLAALVERWPALMAAQLAAPPSDIWEYYGVVSPQLALLMTGVVWLVVLLCGWGFWGLLKRDPVARFWALGAVLAAIPVCAQVPADRLLLFVGVGAMGLLARFFADVFRPGSAARWPIKVLALGLCVVHLVLGPLLLPLRCRAGGDIARMIEPADRTVPDDPGVRDKTVVLVNPPHDALAGYLPTLRAAAGRPRPAHLHWLATAGSPVTIARISDHELEVRPQAGFLARPSDRMQRSPKAPMPVGTRVELTEMQVEIIEATSAGRPVAARMHFTRPLTDPHLIFLQWRDGGYEPFPLPALGQSVTLKAVDFSSLLP